MDDCLHACLPLVIGLAEIKRVAVGAEQKTCNEMEVSAETHKRPTKSCMLHVDHFGVDKRLLQKCMVSTPQLAPGCMPLQEQLLCCFPIVSCTFTYLQEGVQIIHVHLADVSITKARHL